MGCALTLNFKIQTLSEDTKTHKPKYEMQDIFKLYGDDYISRHKLNSMQLKAIADISTCRTSAMGYNAKECSDCKNIEFAYNSCRNRNCPKCQGEDIVPEKRTNSVEQQFNENRSTLEDIARRKIENGDINIFITSGDIS